MQIQHEFKYFCSQCGQNEHFCTKTTVHSFKHINSFNHGHYVAAKCSETREILFRIYTNNENKQDKIVWSRSCIY